MQETWLCSLGREDPLERGMAIHTGILAWRIPWTEMAAVVSRSRTSAQHVQPPANPIYFELNPTVLGNCLSGQSVLLLFVLNSLFFLEWQDSLCLSQIWSQGRFCQQPRTSVQFWMAGFSSNSRAWPYIYKPKCIAMPSPRLSNCWIYCVNTLHP